MEKKKLSDVAYVLNGYAFKSSKYVKSGVRIIRIANVQDGYILDEKPCFYSFESDEDIRDYYLEENDLLVSLTGNVGRVGMMKKELLPAALNQRVACIRIKDKNALNKKYLFYYLRRKGFIQDCKTAAQGVAQLNLSTKWLENYTIWIPSLLEQERIVARIEEMFSQLDDGVETLLKTKEQLAVYRQTVLKEAFESAVGTKKSLKDVCFFITKGTTPPKSSLRKEGEIPFIKVYNLTFNNSLDFTIEPTFVDKKTHHNYLERSIVCPGDVLMNIVGPPMGKVSIVPNTYPEWNINQAIVRYRCLELLNNKYLAYYLGYSGTVNSMKRKAKATAGQLNLTLEICRELTINVPDLDQQRRIVGEIEETLVQCEQIEKIINNALQQAEAIRQSVLKKAFEGNL